MLFTKILEGNHFGSLNTDVIAYSATYKHCILKLNYLKKTLKSTTLYIASLIARAKFVDVAILRLYMKKITNWVHGYLSARVDSGNDFNYVDVRAHGPFYAASQALLYMLAFRYQELVQGKNKRTSDYLFC